MRRWTVRVCPECDYLTAIVNAPVHEQGCSHPDCEEIEVAEVPEGDYGGGPCADAGFSSWERHGDYDG